MHFENLEQCCNYSDKWNFYHFNDAYDDERKTFLVVIILLNFSKNAKFSEENLQMYFKVLFFLLDVSKNAKLSYKLRMEGSVVDCSLTLSRSLQEKSLSANQGMKLLKLISELG